MRKQLLRRSGLGEEHSRQRALPSIRAQGWNKLAKSEEKKAIVTTGIVLDEAGE